MQEPEEKYDSTEFKEIFDQYISCQLTLDQFMALRMELIKKVKVEKTEV